MDYNPVTSKTALIFDFDGTICGIFKNYDLKAVTTDLAAGLQAMGLEFSGDRDAFDAFAEVQRQTAENPTLQKKHFLLCMASSRRQRKKLSILAFLFRARWKSFPIWCKKVIPSAS